MKLGNSTKTQVKSNMDLGDVSLESLNAEQMEAAQNQMVLSNILTQYIYSDPAGTVLGEYASNARDANIMAGKPDVPVRISLPEVLNSQNLSISDDGIGMSTDEVKKYFGASIIASSKRDNDMLVGGFGIGGKSCYSINGVDSFTINTVKDGIRTIAIRRRDSMGVSPLTIVSSVKTDAANGTTVTIPIPEDYIQTIRNRALTRFLTWDVNSVLIDGEEPRHIGSDENYTQVRDLGWIYTGSSRYYHNNIQVIAGGNAYSIDPNENGIAINNILNAWKHPRSRYLSNVNIYLNAEISDIEVSANRSTVRMNQATIALLSEKFAKFMDAFVEDAEARLGAVSTRAEALIAKKELSRIPVLSNFAFEYNGERIPDEVRLPETAYSRGNGFLETIRGSKTRGFTQSTGRLSITTPWNGSKKINFLVFNDTREISDSTLLTHFKKSIRYGVIGDSYLEDNNDSVDDYGWTMTILHDRSILDNEWLKAAVENSAYHILEAKDIVRGSKEFAKNNPEKLVELGIYSGTRASSGQRSRVFYPYFVVGEDAFVENGELRDVKELAHSAKNVFVFQEPSKGSLFRGDEYGNTVREALNTYLEPGDVVLFNLFSRKYEVLVRRLGLEDVEIKKIHSAVESNHGSLMDSLINPDFNEFDALKEKNTGLGYDWQRFYKKLALFAEYLDDNNIEVKNENFMKFLKSASASGDTNDFYYDNQHARKVHSFPSFLSCGLISENVRDKHHEKHQDIIQKARALVGQFNAEFYAVRVLLEINTIEADAQRAGLMESAVTLLNSAK